MQQDVLPPGSVGRRIKRDAPYTAQSGQSDAAEAIAALNALLVKADQLTTCPDVCRDVDGAR
jgi:hypothetical protein